jgi:hypothetical protein
VTTPWLDWTSGPNALRLQIARYEDPDCIDGEDANILVLDATMQGTQGMWRARVPCVRTAELPILRDWFRQLAGGVKRARPRYFLCLDLDLKFYQRGIVDGKQRVIVILRFGLARQLGERAVLSFLVDGQELHAVADQLDQAVKAFPFRAEKAG